MHVHSNITVQSSRDSSGQGAALYLKGMVEGVGIGPDQQRLLQAHQV